MVRLRTKSGKLHELNENVAVVEICDNKGDIAVLIVINEGVTSTYYPGDSEFYKYKKLFKQKSTQVINI